MIDISLLPQTVMLNSQQQATLMAGCDVHMLYPDSISTFDALILPGNGSSYAACRISADAMTLIRYCQIATSDALSAAMLQAITLPMDGVYDCDTATMMIQVAQLLGDDVGEASQWPLYRRAFVYLLGSCKEFQALAREKLQPMVGFAVNGVLPLISYDNTVGTFEAAEPPKGCSPAHLHLEEPPAPSTGLETVSYLEGVEGAGGSSSGSGIGFWGGAIAGATLAVGSAAAYGYWKEHRP